ncbi:thyrotropin-releasing hormone-degrading ectoenzyme, partial [Nephila pilipes]
YAWSVPLSYTTGDGRSGLVWIHDEEELELNVSTESWVKFNVNQTGFYLVNYQKEDWMRFTDLLLTQHEVLSPSDRSNLLFDSFLLAEAGHVPLHLFLSMSQYLENETHFIPWETAYASFVYLCQMLEATEVNVLLKLEVVHKLRHVYVHFHENASLIHEVKMESVPQTAYTKPVATWQHVIHP